MASLLYTPSISYNTTSTSSPPTSPSLSNATYASMLLSHATSLYKAANSHQPYTLFSISIPAVASAYSSSTFGDDLCLAALALALASNQSRYYADAYAFYQSFSLSGTHSVWNWDSKTPAIYVLFVEAATARPGLAEGAGLSVNLTGWQKETENYFDGLVAGNFKNAYLTKGGLLITPEMIVADDGGTDRWPAILEWRLESSVAQPSDGSGYAYDQVRADGFELRKGGVV